MAKYLYRSCPKCKDYLGVVVPEPPEPVRDVPIDARCLRCGFKLAWKVLMGRNMLKSGDEKAHPPVVGLPLSPPSAFFHVSYLLVPVIFT